MDEILDAYLKEEIDFDTALEQLLDLGITHDNAWNTLTEASLAMMSDETYQYMQGEREKPDDG